MTPTIECISSKNETFIAHLINESKNKKTTNYKCGVCIYGDLIFDKKANAIFNIKNDKCNVCNSTIVIK